MTRPSFIRNMVLTSASLICAGLLHAQSEIEGIRVELYYVSDANDATDETGGALVVGSKTYRVYVDLGAGCTVLDMYGDTNHVFSITSTAPFFNNLDRGKTYGHEIADNRLDENTVALDSWLALGRASNLRFGVEEADDDDGSLVGGANNDGGSAGISGGLLVNNDASAGAPLTQSDGLIPLGSEPAVPSGFFQIGDDPAVIFGDIIAGSSFVSGNFDLGCTTPGISGPTSDNVVLLAQLTTSGELAFDLNLLIRRPNGTVARFVATDSVLVGDEQVYPLLHYPPECGCTNPDYLEFNPAAGCDDGSCVTLIAFGCMDPTACNYDPSANFNVPQLCCYGPGNCNGLDVTVLCPDVGIDESVTDPFQVTIGPNPTDGPVRIEWNRATTPVDLVITDAMGRIMERSVITGGRHLLDLQGLATGAYRLQFGAGDTRIVRTLIKL